MRAVSRVVGGRDDQGDGAVDGNVAVQEADRICDPAGSKIVVEGNRSTQRGLVVERRVRTARDRDGAQLFPRRAELVHVPASMQTYHAGGRVVVEGDVPCSVPCGTSLDLTAEHLH